MKKRVIEGIEVYRGSGNVFAGLDLPDADTLQIKAGLVIEIRRAIRQQGDPASRGHTDGAHTTEGLQHESVAGHPANSIQARSGYRDHVVKPAEVRRNDAV